MEEGEKGRRGQRKTNLPDEGGRTTRRLEKGRRLERTDKAGESRVRLEKDG